jgi:hypothetical protein
MNATLLDFNATLPELNATLLALNATLQELNAVSEKNAILPSYYTLNIPYRKVQRESVVLNFSSAIKKLQKSHYS